MKQFLIEYTHGQSLSWQLRGLTEELEKNPEQTLLLHLYIGIMDRELVRELIRDLSELFPEGKIVGGHSAGEIRDGKLMPPGILISGMLFQKTEIGVYRYDELRGHEVEVGKSLCREIEETPYIKAVEVLLPGAMVDTLTFFSQLEASPDWVQFFGGYLGSVSAELDSVYVVDDKDIWDDSLLAITYSGKDFHISVDKTAGWQTIGMPFRITKAQGHRLMEINHVPAVEVYEKYLQIDRNDHLEEQSFEFPLMVKLKDEEVLRHTIFVEEDGSLILAGNVLEGTDVYLSYGNPSQIIEKVNKRLEYVSQFQPEAVLLYSCVVRKSFWEDFVDMEMLPFQALCPTGGFFTLGEVRRDPVTGKIIEYNITLLSIAMREGEKKKEEVEIVKVDDSVLKSQASLVRRLAKLVYSTTSELQKAYENLRSLNRQLLAMAETDALTGLYNRRKIEELINSALDEYEETGEPVSLIMIDVDHFKMVNDNYGHEVGDTVLCTLSSLMKEAASQWEGSEVGRWGGEEFFILLPSMDRKMAFGFAEDLRKTAQLHDFPQVEHITISMGVITVQGKENRQGVFTRVDNALYRSKQTGRNRVTEAE